MSQSSGFLQANLLLEARRVRTTHAPCWIPASRIMTIPIALTIAGSDSSGGAGIQADLKSFAALGVYGASVITALTAQNTRGVTGIHQIPSDFVTAQIDAVFSDLEIGAVKTGMVATSGDRLLRADAVEALRTKLIPLASLITPNLPEAAALLDEPVAPSEN